MSQEIVEKTFSVSAPARLRLGNIRGTVTILPGEEGTIRLKAVKNLDSGDADRTEIFIEQRNDGTVKVETRYPQNGWLFFAFSKPCKVDYTVQVPANCDLKVSGVSSSTTIQGIAGDITIATVSGTVRLNSLSGELKVNSVSGSVTGDELSGLVKVDTVSGDVNLSDGNFPRLDSSTVSGNLVVETPLGEGPYRFNTVSGEVDLMIPADTGCLVQSNSISGRIRTSLPSHYIRKQGGKRQLEVQSGGPLIYHHSISGNLRITAPDQPARAGSTSREDAKTQADMGAATENRMEVLERIARGELSVDEGIQELT